MRDFFLFDIICWLKLFLLWFYVFINRIKKSRTRGYKTPAPIKGTGCDQMNILRPNNSIFSGLHDITIVGAYSLTPFVKAVF